MLGVVDIVFVIRKIACIQYHDTFIKIAVYYMILWQLQF